MTQVSLAEQLANLMSGVWEESPEGMSRSALAHLYIYGEITMTGLGRDLLEVRFTDGSSILLNTNGTAYALNVENDADFQWDFDWMLGPASVSRNTFQIETATQMEKA